MGSHETFDRHTNQTCTKAEQTKGVGKKTRKLLTIQRPRGCPTIHPVPNRTKHKSLTNATFALVKCQCFQSKSDAYLKLTAVTRLCFVVSPVRTTSREAGSKIRDVSRSARSTWLIAGTHDVLRRDASSRKSCCHGAKKFR